MITYEQIQEDVGKLKKIPFFSKFSTSQLKKINNKIKMRTYSHHDTIFSKGDFAEQFYLVLQGHVKLFLLAKNGDMKVVELIAPGQLFAEASIFFVPNLYPVNAQAVEKVQTISFDRNIFLDLLKESSETCIDLLGGLSLQVHKLIREIDSLTLKNATYRLANYLLEGIPSNNTGMPQFILPAPKKDVASKLSMQPETFSRILSDFHQKKIIEVQSSKVTLCDVPQLRELISR